MQGRARARSDGIQEKRDFSGVDGTFARKARIEFAIARNLRIIICYSILILFSCFVHGMILFVVSSNFFILFKIRLFLDIDVRCSR